MVIKFIGPCGNQQVHVRCKLIVCTRMNVDSSLGWKQKKLLLALLA